MYSFSRQEEKKGALGEEEKEKNDYASVRIFHGWNILPLTAVQPAAIILAT